MKRTLLGFLPLTLALATFSVGCGDDGGSTDGSDETTGDGDGDPTGDGDGDPTTTGDGDGDPTTTGDGDGDPTGDTDSDNDGIPDGSDNCPDDANPNQLDFDGNGAGNVCDVQVFSTVSGTLTSTASAAALGQSCNIPIDLVVTGGEIQVQLDDDAAVAAFDIVTLDIADILDKECDLNLVTATVSIKDFGITNVGDPFPVSVAHSQAAHDAGSIAGDSDDVHPVLAEGTLEAAVGNDPPMPSDLMLDATLPTFTANIMGGGTSGTMSWANGMHVLATDVFMVDAPIIGQTNIDFELRGLIGTLSVAP